MTADEECCYCQEGRLHRRSWAFIGTVAGGFALLATLPIMRALGLHSWLTDYVFGAAIGAWTVRSHATFKRLSVPQRCPVTDDMIRHGAIRAFAKHLHEYSDPIQREKLPSIARAFIERRGAR